MQGNDHLLTVARYVEANPVQAKMVSAAKDWPWSSHRENAGTGSDPREVPVPLVDKGLLDLPADWSDYVDTPLTSRELNNLRLSLHHQVPFMGTGSF